MSLVTINFEQLRLVPGDRLLDLGCGEGRHAISAYMAAPVQAVGVDLSLEDIETTRERFNEFRDSAADERSLVMGVADGTRLPFADQCFDKVICSEVLEHLHDYQAALREIHRVLKAGGIAALSVPRYVPEWVCWKLSRAYHEVEGGHVRIFNAGRLSREVERIGFRRLSKHHAHALHVPYWWLKCLLWRSDDSEAWVVRQYHRFLTWDLMKAPWLTRLLDRLLNPIMGKSVVMYFVRTQ